MSFFDNLLGGGSFIGDGQSGNSLFGNLFGIPSAGNVIRGFTGELGAEAQLEAARMQQEGLREARRAQEQAYREVAPGLAQFMSPGRAAAFGLGPQNQWMTPPSYYEQPQPQQGGGGGGGDSPEWWERLLGGSGLLRGTPLDPLGPVGPLIPGEDAGPLSGVRDRFATGFEGPETTLSRRFGEQLGWNPNPQAQAKPAMAGAGGVQAAPVGGFQPGNVPSATGPGGEIAYGGGMAAPGMATPTKMEADPLQYDPTRQLDMAAGAMGPEAQAAFFQRFQEDPGQAWLREQGMRGIENQASATGGLGGGARLKALSRFNQGLANQQYQQRLAQLGQLSQRDIGLASGLGNLRTGLGSAQGQAAQSAAQAGAQGALGAANAYGQGAGNIASALGSAAAYFFSDRQLKENVEKIDNPLERLMSLNGYVWDWKQPINQQSAGVMADEIEKVLSEAVTEHNGLKMVDYPAVVGLAIEAIKELKEAIK